MIKKDSFADGIRMMNTKGALVVPVRLNKRMKEILLILIEEDKSNSEIIFEDCEDCYNRFMNATTWLFNQLNKNEKNIKIRFTKDIARTLHFWLCDKKYHHLFSNFG